MKQEIEIAYRAIVIKKCVSCLKFKNCKKAKRCKKDEESGWGCWAWDGISNTMN